jgi:DNA-directed RNA polymerase specialized sigma24 family protein
MSFTEYVERLPPMERDILRLHMDLRKSQTEVAKILGVSQPTVNYRYKRARERLDFMVKLPVVTSEEVRFVLHKLGARGNDVQAMVLYVETNSQSEVARRMETSQGAVRHWIHRALVNHLQTDVNDADVHRRVRTACSMLVNKPGIFNEPQKPGPVVKQQRVDQRLTKAPKTKGRYLVGERLLILDGIYASLDGTILEISETTVRMHLDLESQDIFVTWAR